MEIEKNEFLEEEELEKPKISYYSREGAILPINERTIQKRKEIEEEKR